MTTYKIIIKLSDLKSVSSRLLYACHTLHWVSSLAVCLFAHRARQTLMMMMWLMMMMLMMMTMMVMVILVTVSECRGVRHPSGDTATRLSSSNLLRSRSSQSLRQTHDMTSLPNDERLTVLVQMFWISVSLLESDFEYEFLLAVRLLHKVRLSHCNTHMYFNKFERTFIEIAKKS